VPSQMDWTRVCAGRYTCGAWDIVRDDAIRLWRVLRDGQTYLNDRTGNPVARETLRDAKAAVILHTRRDVEHRPFRSAIDDSPYEDGPRAVYADWLEEQQHPHAAAVRWLADNHVHPCLTDPGRRELREAWTWTAGQRVLLMPPGIADCLVRRHGSDQLYPTRLAAELAFCQAWHAVKPRLAAKQGA
jgi:uncharacterized protein (TIGR02996 family)